MKLKNMIIGFLALSLLTVSLTACGNAGNNTEATEITTEAVTEETTEETSNEAEVTEEPTEETVEPDVTEAPEPTEEPVVSGDPNIIDGYDFTDFNEHNNLENYFKIVNTMEYDSLKLIVIKTDNHHQQVIDILSDGDKYTIPYDWKGYDENNEVNYWFNLYYPKSDIHTEVDGMSEYYMDTPTYYYCVYSEDPEYPNTISANIRDASILTEDGYDMTCRVVYGGGEEETITITVYPEQ